MRRPIYNVAHMVNGESEINKEWVNYANAIESDLTFNADGSPKKFYHGFPCDFGRYCSREDDTDTHFETIRHKAQDSDQNFALFWMDLKLGDSGITESGFYSSGQKLAEAMTSTGSLFHLVS